MSAHPSGDPIAPNPDAPARPPRPSWEVAAETGRPTPAPAARPAPASQPSAAPAPQAAAPPRYAPPQAAPLYAPPPAMPQAASPDASAAYDLAGNALPSSGPVPSPYAQPHVAGHGAPSAPYGYPPAPAAPGSWPPAPTAPGGWQSIGDGTDRVSRLKWNWGAFLIPFWWSLFNGQKNVAIIIFVTNVGSRYIPAPYDWIVVLGQFGLQIYLGLMGHRLAWASDRFGGDYDHYIRTQRAWMIWGFALAGLIGVGVACLVALVPGVLGVLAGGSQPVHHVSPYGGSGAPSP